MGKDNKIKFSELSIWLKIGIVGGIIYLVGMAIFMLLWLLGTIMFLYPATP